MWPATVVPLHLSSWVPMGLSSRGTQLTTPSSAAGLGLLWEHHTSCLHRASQPALTPSYHPLLDSADPPTPGRQNPWSLTPFSAWRCCACPPPVTIGKGILIGPRGNMFPHAFLQISVVKPQPYLLLIIINYPCPIRELSSGRLVPGHKEPKVPPSNR